MIHYYSSLLLGLLGFFIGTSLLTTGTNCSSLSQMRKKTQNKESAFFAYDHIIKIQSGEDATTRSNQTAFQMPQKTDPITSLQQISISHKGNHQSNQQHKRKLKYVPNSSS